MSQASTGRSIVAVVVGYLAMFLCVFMGMTLAYLSLGVERAFRPNSFEVSGLWNAAALFVNFLAALAGGIVCVTVGRGTRPVFWLIAVILMLGIVSAYLVFTSAAATQPRPGTLGNLEAMRQARMPLWAAIVDPLIGVFGVWVGSRLARKP